ncbi:hypothetical protein WKI68_11145 [Streptomyces sp. MS1.HAVA.3]|uniref:TIGR04222 domain-containing membrane protein n=1 Tax=Streptomyces caledonius TaxID=3134107 RepID=A0ABU8U3S4_9ACTN
MRILIPVSLLLTFVGFVVQSGPQVPFIAKVLVVLVIGILVGVICAARARSRVTPAGRRALLAIRSAYRNDPTPYVQTALFGLRGLRDPYLRQQLVPAIRGTRLAAAQSGPRSHFHPYGTDTSSHGSTAALLPILWCATSDGGGGGSSCGGGGSSCGGSSGSGCGSSGSSGSSCSSSSSSCSSSSGSSCSSSSSS